MTDMSEGSELAQALPLKFKPYYNMSAIKKGGASIFYDLIRYASTPKTDGLKLA